jgi:hypothetical protein
MLHSATTNINQKKPVFSLNSEQLHNANPFLQLFQCIVAKELNRYHGREGHPLKPSRVKRCPLGSADSVSRLSPVVI